MSGFTTDYDKLGGQYVDDGTGKGPIARNLEEERLQLLPP